MKLVSKLLLILFILGLVSVCLSQEENFERKNITRLDALREQICRDPYKFPAISFACAPRESIDDYKSEDFVVDGYAHHATVKMEMRK